MRDLAQRLRATSRTISNSHVNEAVLVNEGLRLSLTRFTGADGFVSLLRRALALASADVPALRSVNLGADGHLNGWEQFIANAGTGAAGVADEAAVAITSHLLGLLVTFLGEPFTLRLVREAWANTDLNELSLNIEND